MTDKVKLPGGITVGSSCLPEAPAPIKRCCARLNPSILESAKAAQSGFLSRKRPTYFFMMSSSGTPSSSFGRECRATLMNSLLPNALHRALSRGTSQCTLNHNADERLTIAAAGMDIVRWIDGGGRRRFGPGDHRLVDDITVDNALDGGEPQRPVGDADGADMGIGGLSVVHIVKHRGTRQREIAAAAGEFRKAETAAHRPGRQANFGDDFVGLQSRHQGPANEIRGRDDTGAGFAERGNPGIAGHGDARQFGRGIGMRHAAADGAAIADLIMRDMLDRRYQEWMRLAQPRVVKNVAPAHHGAEPNAVIGDFDLPKLAKLAQVDDE